MEKTMPRHDLARWLSGCEPLLWLGAVLTAVLLASVGVTWARGNDACAQLCAAIYPPGPLRGKCISDAAHGLGPCVNCDVDVDCCDADVDCPSVQCDGDILEFEGQCKLGLCVFNSAVDCSVNFPGTTCSDGACRDQTGAIVFP